MNAGFIKHTAQGVVYFTFRHFDETHLVTHCFSSKVGGVSPGNYKTMNLGYNSGDLKENVDENHIRIADVVGFDHQALVFSKQVHETHVFKVPSHFNPLEDQILIQGTDGLMTKEPKHVLHTVYADCVPIYILDPVRKAIGIAHSGWRGTVGKIGAELLHEMHAAFGSEPDQCLAGIGPSIGPCCFEVGDEVVDAFKSEFADDLFLASSHEGRKAHIDLWHANRYVLIEAGMHPEAIICAEMCTCCHPEYFFLSER